MKVLVVGNGGREHALAWKIAQSPRVDRVFVAPGNAGTAEDAENVDIPADDFGRLIKFARENSVKFTVVGPEAPLAAGIVDAFASARLRVFGPSKAAAQLEASKVFCKNLLRHADVPSADYRVFRDAKAAVTYLKDRDDIPVVVKADGLAAGKGVVVCDNREQALEAVERIALKKEFGAAGNQLIIEERLYTRLVALAERARAQAPELADRLLSEIERADLRAPGEMPADVVTLGSEVTFREQDRTRTVQIVAPEDADIERGRISVLTPVGAALLGLTVGQKISWDMPDKRVAVLEVLAVRQPNDTPASDTPAH